LSFDARDTRQEQSYRLLHVRQLDVEDELGVGRNDAARAPGAIAQLRRDNQATLAADAHPGDALVPALDDLAGAQAEGEGPWEDWNGDSEYAPKEGVSRPLFPASCQVSGEIAGGGDLLER
jgi:uncharacterized protein with von Willebrand factor type A (vWA) domain